MAEYWVHDKAAAGGDGLSIDTPLQAVPSNAFGAGHVWNLKYGSVWDLGGDAFTSGNSTTVRAYGDPADGNPWFTGTRSIFFNCATAQGAVVFEDISFVRSGAQSGVGIQAIQMTHANASFTMRRCMVAGFNDCITASRTRKVTIENCDILGGATTYGLKGQAYETFNCNDWRIVGNTFDCGTDIELYVSDDTAGSVGSFNNLVIEDNTMAWSGGTPGGTSMFLRGRCNATDYAATASITTGGTKLVRNIGSPVWPAWPNGTVIFLAGWSNVANFGTVTVTAGGGTREATVTNLGATLVDEAEGLGKGAGIRDPLRAFNNPTIRRNVIRNRGLTPMFIDNFIGGVLEANHFEDTVAVGQVSAAIEAFNCVGTIALYNIIRGITGHVPADGHGIFWDGACENCVAYGNYISGLRPTSDNSFDTFGTALAAFHCKACVFHSNIVVDCRHGSSANAVTTTALFYNNTISGCNRGFLGSSSLTDGAIEFKNNVIQQCITGILDEGSSVVSNNAWWQNTADTHTGTLAAKDAAAITDDPKLTAGLRPMPGSPLIGAGLHLGYTRDFDGVQRPNPPSVGARDVATLVPA